MRGHWILISALIPTAIAGAVAVAAFGAWATLAPDSFVYLETARGLYEHGALPAARTMTPPGFPVLLAPLFAAGDPPLAAIRILLAAGFAATAGLTFLMHRRTLGDGWAMVAALLVATSSVGLMQTTVVLSEALFTPLCLASLLCCAGWSRRERVHLAALAAGGLLIGATILVRSTGWVLVPTILFAVLGRRGTPWARRAGEGLVVGLCVAALPAAWEWRQRSLGDGPSYAHIWTTPRSAEGTMATGVELQIERLVRFGPARLGDLMGAMVPPHLGWRLLRPPTRTWAAWLVGGFFVLATAAGAVTRRAPHDIFICLYLAMVSVWPWEEGPRLVAPLAPLLVGYVVWPLRWAARQRRAGGLRVAATVMAAGLVITQLAEARHTLGAIERDAGRRVAEFAEMSDFADRLRSIDGSRMVGVTPDGCDRKRLLMGAAYLARRPMALIDLHPGAAIDLGVGMGELLFVHESCYGEVARRVKASRVGRQADFVVLGRGDGPRGRDGDTAPEGREFERGARIP